MTGCSALAYGVVCNGDGTLRLFSSNLISCMHAENIDVGRPRSEHLERHHDGPIASKDTTTPEPGVHRTAGGDIFFLRLLRRREGDVNAVEKINSTSVVL